MIKFRNVLKMWAYAILLQCLTYVSILVFEYLKKCVDEIIVLVEMGKKGMTRDVEMNPIVYTTFKRRTEWLIAFLILDIKEKIDQEKTKE